MKFYFALTLGVALTLAGSGFGAGFVQLEEDFDDGRANGWHPSTELWRVTENGYYGIEHFGFEVYEWSSVGRFSWADYRVELDLISFHSVNQTFAVRVQPNRDCYLVNMRAHPWNDLYLSKWSGGVQTHLAVAPVTNAIGAWHRMSIQVVGSAISIIVDGREVLTYLDPVPYLTGRIAAVSYTGGVEQHQRMGIDNVVLYLRADKDLGEEAMSWSGVKTLFR